MAWFPLAIVLLMVAATIEAGVHHDWRKALFWFLDAALTAVSAFMLK